MSEFVRVLGYALLFNAYFVVVGIGLLYEYIRERFGLNDLINGAGSQGNSWMVPIHAIIFHYGQRQTASWKGANELEDGFIKIYRSLMKWEWYTNTNTKIVFIHLLLNANWEDSRFQGIDVPKGSLICGRKKLAKDLGLSEREIRTAIKHLKSTNEITTKTTNRFTVITIVNWEKYQGFENQATNKTTNNESNKRPTSDHIKEYKNIRNKEYYKKPESNSYESDYDFDEMERRYGLK